MPDKATEAQRTRVKELRTLFEKLITRGIADELDRQAVPMNNLSIACLVLEMLSFAAELTVKAGQGLPTFVASACDEFQQVEQHKTLAQLTTLIDKVSQSCDCEPCKPQKTEETN